LDRNATEAGKYGPGAFAALWSNVTYNQTVPFTTTVSPTPLPTSELIFPPPLYYSDVSNDDVDCYKLPKDFIWGVAGSAFQIEGGLTYGGRGPSNLDKFGALPNSEDIANAEITDMNYFLYKQDIARLAAIGVPYYSFSISWTRIVPFGEVGSPINLPGLEHYDDLIDTCLEYGITPIVTLQHGDNPLGIPLGDPRYPEAFLYYAKQVMTRYGDRVPVWVTLNEPNIAFGPFFGVPYSAMNNLLLAHAKVYHWYKEELGGTGQITVKFANNLGLPLSGNSTDDARSQQRYQDFILGCMANPIFLGQQIPAEILSTPHLNVTALTDDELAFIHHTADFWSFDPYTAQFVTPPPGGIDACAANVSDPLYPVCVATTNVQADGWLMGQASYAYAYLAPQYVRQQFSWVWNTYRPSGILVAEFGFNPWMEWSKPLVLQRYDLERSLYYFGFLREMLKSIYEDGVNVIGALAWSFL
jgi:beta-glucosidase/6-phospho-beta-glucosidase/beta-galactosidase